MGDQIGEVTHYFGDISVAVVELSDDLSVGDQVTFVRNGEELFEQEIDSMEVDHDQVEQAGSGDEVAIKVEEKVKEDTEVYKS